MKEKGIDPTTVVFSGYGLTPEAQKAAEEKRHVSFSGVGALDWTMPDARYNNPVVFASRQKEGAIGIYDFAQLQAMGAELGNFRADVWSLNGTIKEANRAKLGELRLKNKNSK